MIDFSANEVDSRKLKKIQELVQHFIEESVDIMYQNRI